jgi:hypothetical protein
VLTIPRQFSTAGDGEPGGGTTGGRFHGATAPADGEAERAREQRGTHPKEHTVTTTPTLNGQVIGLAHYATRAVFLRRLATVDTTFEQSIVLNLLAASGGTLTRGEIVEGATFSLKVDPEVVLEAIEQLAGRGTVAAADEVSLTDAGQALNARIRGWVGELTERLYGDLPADDLAVAARILTTLTERANAELAS